MHSISISKKFSFKLAEIPLWISYQLVKYYWKLVFFYKLEGERIFTNLKFKEYWYKVKVMFVFRNYKKIQLYAVVWN